jgi:hypothetical protein
MFNKSFYSKKSLSISTRDYQQHQRRDFDGSGRSRGAESYFACAFCTE